MASRIRFRRFYECDTESDRSLDFGADSLLYCLDTQKYYRIYNSSYQEVQPDEVIFISPIPVSKLGISGIPDGTKFLRDDGSWSSVPGGANVVSGVGTAGQVAYWTNTSILSGSSTFAFTPTSQLLVNNTVTASGAAARGINFTPTLIAADNNDVLSALEIAPTFTNGAFTGVSNYGIWIKGGSLAGPNNATFNILSVVPSQASVGTAGNSINITSSNGIGGSTNNTSGAGGNITITAGNAGSTGLSSSNGGSITLQSGVGTSTGQAGSINLLGGSGAASSFTTGGIINIIGGACVNAGSSFGGGVNIKAGEYFNSSGRGGSLILEGGGQFSGGNTTLSAGTTTSGNAGNLILKAGNAQSGNTGGTVTISSGTITNSGNISINTPDAVGGVNAGFSGNISLTTGNALNGGSIGAASGNISLIIGNASSSATYGGVGTGSLAGSINLVGGTGSAMNADSVAIVGGTGSSVNITSGNGGNATGLSTNRTGGSSGNITISTGTGGSGTTTGNVGSILFKVNSTSTVLEIGYASAAPRIGFFNSTPVPKPSAVTSSQGIADALSSLGLLASSTISGGGGHQIVDSANTVYTQREKLKFARLSVADDSLNNQTIVTRPADTFVGTTPPGSPVEGDVWTNSETWNTYKYYDSYWVEVSSTTLPTNVISDSGNKLYLFNSY